MGFDKLTAQLGAAGLAFAVALAMAREPADGRFETGAANLTALAQWVVANIWSTGPARA